MKATIGGKRLGSGNKMTTELHNYNRSTHNLSRSWKNSMTNGVLYPCFIDVALNGDTWKIGIENFVRTLPTKGPLFGSFKMQVDFFKVPIRLYQGILHNNPMNIGLKMAQVKLPQIAIAAPAINNRPIGTNVYNSQVATNSLVKFLGISGLGQGIGEQTRVRNINAVPFLGYYDIFKNYYANLQEEMAYVIIPDIEESTSTVYNATYTDTSGQGGSEIDANWQEGDTTYINDVHGVLMRNLTWNGNALNPANLTISIVSNKYDFTGTLQEAAAKDFLYIQYESKDKKKIIAQLSNRLYQVEPTATIEWRYREETLSTSRDIKLQPFKLENIDEMRMKLLSENQLGSQYVIYEDELLPYSVNCMTTEDLKNYCAFELNGLVVKTYQSDLFNNWIQTEWIDGENGISAITAVSTADGSFTIDQLTMQKKIWDLLNRVAVSGGTYQDWQDAVYTSKTQHTTETPLYCGGMSTEIVFEEIVSSAETSDKPQGNLAGKGRSNGKNGGYIEIDINEPSFIMGIASITPRLDYSQGNKWFMTDIQSIDDLHKPALDGIGFQDLIIEQMNWLDTIIAPNGIVNRRSAGKVPAWINYMTAYDECFGDFANEQGNAFMVLNRNYEYTYNEQMKKYDPSDITTYIDPSKFNYAFAYSALASQNFWVQLAFSVETRRVMSAKIIPNL